MKKMFAVCFAFAFLLAVVVGCPHKPSDSKPNGSAPAVDPDGDTENISLFSSDEGFSDETL
ncbi:MAG: hypothetical protein FWD31_01375 [Planctomycetaceae bacterium]|nr:hypothetical protein [Planctomycetaceae bacterium]